MIGLMTASVCFFLLHRLVSGSSLRARLAARLGEQRFRALFAVASLAGLAWLAAAYVLTPDSSRGSLIPVPTPFWHLQVILQPFALLLVVAGLTSPNPGTVGQEALAGQPDLARGLLRITRHPFLWGIALLGIGHIAAVPSPRNLVVFGALLTVALAGTRSIDAKRRAALGSAWNAFEDATSNLPFSAVIDGRQALPSLEEVGFVRLLAAGLLSVISVLAHPAFWRAGFTP